MCTETVFWSGCHMENRRNISTNARGRGGSRAGSLREHAISVYERAVGKVLEW